MPSKKELEVYGNHIFDYKPTIGSLLSQILQEKLFRIKRSKLSAYQEHERFRPEEDRLKGLPLTYIAVVQDGIVKEMLRINEETAAIILSDESSLVEFDPRKMVVQKGMTYIDGKFEIQADKVNKELAKLVNSINPGELEEDEKD